MFLRHLFNFMGVAGIHFFFEQPVLLLWFLLGRYLPTDIFVTIYFFPANGLGLGLKGPWWREINSLAWAAIVYPSWLLVCWGIRKFTSNRPPENVVTAADVRDAICKAEDIVRHWPSAGPVNRAG